MRALFVDGPIEVDMSSLAGGGPVQTTADQLAAGFRAGLHAGSPLVPACPTPPGQAPGGAVWRSGAR
jgi:hypothetical protein